jgi:hypothetical protein
VLLAPLLYLILYGLPPDVTLPESLLDGIQLQLDLLIDLGPILHDLRRVAVDGRRRQTLIECPQVLLRLTHFQVGLRRHHASGLQQGRALSALVYFFNVRLVGLVVCVHKRPLLVVQDLVSLRLLQLKLLLTLTARIVHSLLILFHMLSIFS